MRLFDCISAQVTEYKTKLLREKMKDYYRTIKQGQVNLPEWMDEDFISIEKDIDRIKQDGNAFHSLFCEMLK